MEMVVMCILSKTFGESAKSRRVAIIKFEFLLQYVSLSAFIMPNYFTSKTTERGDASSTFAADTRNIFNLLIYDISMLNVCDRNNLLDNEEQSIQSIKATTLLAIRK